MDLHLTDRVYLVTGGSRGLGRATAQALVDDGAKVVVSGRNADTVHAAASELGENAVGVVADNSAPETPATLLAAAREAFGRVDGALISVGGPPPGPVLESKDEDWSRSFDSVFLGGVRLARDIGRELPEGGSIAAVLSSSVRQPLGGMAISNGLRPGLGMVLKTLSDELGPAGVRVNGLLPGRIGTDRVAELDESTGDAAAAKERALAGIPLGRYGLPEEFGAAAAFLLSPASGFVTGVMLPVDGGMLRAL